MRRDGLFSYAFGEMMRDSFGKASRVYKNKRGAVLPDKLRQAVIDFVPHFVRGYRAQFASGHLYRKIHDTLVADLHNHRIGPTRSGEKMRHQLDWLLRGGQTYADQRAFGERLQPLQR